MKRFFIVLTLLMVIFGCESESKTQETKKVDVPKKTKSFGTGRIENGLRLFTSEEAGSGSLEAYRGDYVKILVEGDLKEFTIDSLKIAHTFPEDKSNKAYFKLKQTGEFAYKFGEIQGSIVIKEYSQPNYKAVSAKEGAEIIKNISPFILDVRTLGEYNSGHIEGATLLPVQVIQREYTKLLEHKEKPIFIYCASGNRSTVAARILIENGFTNIYNLRPGISGWYRAGLKIVK